MSEVLRTWFIEFRLLQNSTIHSPHSTLCAAPHFMNNIRKKSPLSFFFGSPGIFSVYIEAFDCNVKLGVNCKRHIVGLVDFAVFPLTGIDKCENA
jgi:hypothetical protein